MAKTDYRIVDFLSRIVLESPGMPDAECHMHIVRFCKRLQFQGIDIKIPTLGTIGRLVSNIKSPVEFRKTRDLMTADEKEPWLLMEEPNVEKAKVLKRAYYSHHFELGYLSRLLTKPQAEYIWKVYQLVPDLPPHEQYQIGMEYYVRALTKKPTRDLDNYLGFTPWKSDKHQAYYAISTANFRKPFAQEIWEAELVPPI